MQMLGSRLALLGLRTHVLLARMFGVWQFPADPAGGLLIETRRFLMGQVNSGQRTGRARQRWRRGERGVWLLLTVFLERRFVSYVPGCQSSP